MDDTLDQTDFIGWAADIVSAYVRNNSVPASDLPGLINSVYGALTNVGPAPAAAALEPAKPAVSVKKSVTPDYIICLEDGKKYKSLKRHLSSMYDMTPDQYREKWNLPADYPMVAPNYAATRSQLARASGLGQLRKKIK